MTELPGQLPLFDVYHVRHIVDRQNGQYFGNPGHQVVVAWNESAHQERPCPCCGLAIRLDLRRTT